MLFRKVRVSTVRLSALAALALCVATTVTAQPTPRVQTPEPTRRATAARTTEVPVIDGLLDERLWQDATPLVGFVQPSRPKGPATEPTEVRILYDDKALYIGVVCFDSEPQHLVTTDSRRDSSLSGQDAFQIILDTYHDKQNGYLFGTTPVGLQYDAQVRNEGETIRGGPPTGSTGGNNTGAGAGVNTNWDGSWEVKTRVTDKGWTAEFRIPLRTLRYGSAPQTWGLNFARSIERKREAVYWSPLSRIYSLTRLSSAGELTGLNMATPRDFKVMPYAIGSANRNFLSASELEYDQGGDWGIDSKIGVTSSTTLDLTYNTDFAQVEVDEQQINLTRFNLLFPEKRPFFLEHRGLFAVGRPGEIDLFFSRRIGIADNGTLLPIVGGARLTGKAKGGVNIGFLDMQTDDVGPVLWANNFAAARVSRPRQPLNGGRGQPHRDGRQGGGTHRNRTWGVDGRLGVKEAITFGLRFRTKRPAPLTPSMLTAGSTPHRKWETQVGYAGSATISIPKSASREREGISVGASSLRRHAHAPLAKHGLREWEPHASYEGHWGFDGLQERRPCVDSRLDFENGPSGPLRNAGRGLREPLRYRAWSPPASIEPYFLTWATRWRKWISASMAANVGGFLSGSQVSLSPQINLRQEGRLTSSLRLTRNDIDLPEGSFVTNLVVGRMTYNFSTSVNTSALIQYNDRTHRWSTNLRFNWQRDAGTGLYVVYNDTEGFEGLGPVSRTFIVKYSHMFDVLK